MKRKININDLEPSQVIIDFAKNFNIDYDEDNNEFCVRIPEEMGTGYIKAYNFDHGIGIIEHNYLLKNELHLRIQKDIIQPLKLIFNRDQNFYHQFENENEIHEIKRLENILLSSKPNNEHLFKIPANKPINIFSLQINRKLFEEKIEVFLNDMHEDLIQVFRDVNGINLFYYKGFYSLEIAKFIEEFVECNLEGFMKSVYLEGKAYEILTHQLQQYLDDLNEPEKRIILRKATIESIEEAVKIIQEEIDVLSSVAILSKRVGLNQNTLQNGFQQLYKTSVKEYIKNYRINKAKELLEKSDLNITEITYKIGISSRSYFSKVFKQQFGLTPKQYLNQVRNKQNKSKSA